MQGRDAFGLQGPPEPIGVVAPITPQPLGLGQAVQQGGGTDVFGDLARCREKADGPSVRIDHGVQLVHAAQAIRAE